MRRHDYTKTSLVVSLACMTLFGGYVVGVKRSGSEFFSFSGGREHADRGRLESRTRVCGHCSRFGSGIDYDDVSEFIQGRYEIVRALEQAIVGMKSGEEKKVELSPEEGFGTYDAEKKIIVQKTLLPPGATEGAIVQNALGDFATVAEVSDRTVVLDYNHPLAGKPVVVQLKILKVENP